MGIVRVTNPAVVNVDGIPTALRENEAYDEDSDVVRDYPWAFARDNVEQATAGPGERRNIRRQ